MGKQLDGVDELMSLGKRVRSVEMNLNSWGFSGEKKPGMRSTGYRLVSATV